MGSINMEDVTKGLHGYLRHTVENEAKKIPSLSFTYFTLEQMGALKSLLLASSSSLKQISENYGLYMSKSDSLTHLCPIYQIVKEDLENRPKRDIPTATYNRFVEQFGQENVDLLVVSKDVIKDHIKNIINFTIDEVYHEDEMIIEFDTIECLNAAEIVMGKTSSIPNLIYEVIQEHFDIVTQSKRFSKMIIWMKKRGNKDD